MCFNKSAGFGFFNRIFQYIPTPKNGCAPPKPLSATPTFAAYILSFFVFSLIYQRYF